MTERGITEAQVAQCLADADMIERDVLPDRIRYLRCVRGHTRMLRVVVRIEQRTRVITVLPDKRIRCPRT